MSVPISEPHSDKNLPQANSLNVVVVEDHDGLRDVITEVLRSHGHAVVGLTCAEEVDDKAGGTPIDLLIVDLNLPGEDGLSLAQRFRAAQPMSGIIIVTARETVEDRVSAYASGADIYLKKPVSMVELMAAVNSVARRLGAQTTNLRQSQSQSLNQTTLSAVSIDIEKMRLHGPLGDATLTSAETVLIAALARAPGRRLETTALLGYLNLDPQTYSKSAFEVRVVRLRRKLIDVGADKQCIRSTRMQGYQLSPSLTIC